MGLSLTYRTAHAVPRIVRDEMVAEALAAELEYPWILCEPISLGLPDVADRLGGTSEVHLFLSREQVELARQTEGVCHDLEALLIQLIDWSRRFQLIWKLTLADEPLGSIRKGFYDPNLFDQFDALAALALESGQGEAVGWQQKMLDTRVLGVFDPPPRSDAPTLRIWPEPD